MKTITLLIPLFLPLFLSAQLIQDDSYLDPDFIVFKAQLVLAIEERDSLALSELMADTVWASKDACGTRGCTKEVFFQFSFDVHDEKSWNDLSEIVRFGFRRRLMGHPYGLDEREHLTYQAPSYLNQFNYENTVIILGENVNIRKRPSLTSEIIQPITYDTVSCQCQFGMDESDRVFSKADQIYWLKVTLRNGQKGYVAEHLTSNVISREISVRKINGAWKIISIMPTVFC